VNEGEVKVELSISTSLVTLTPLTIAAWVIVSRQVFDVNAWSLQWIGEHLVERSVSARNSNSSTATAVRPYRSIRSRAGLHR
jgi:hypothetical protein